MQKVVDKKWPALQVPAPTEPRSSGQHSAGPEESKSEAEDTGGIVEAQAAKGNGMTAVLDRLDDSSSRVDNLKRCKKSWKTALLRT